MKAIKLLALFFTGILVFASCSSDDDNPAPVNEEELITSVTITLQAEGEEDVTMTYSDESGLGHDHDHEGESHDEDDHDHEGAQGVVSGALKPNVTYTGAIVLLNESVSPVENITAEIEEEADEHQFFFQPIGSELSITTTYADTENDYLSNGSDNHVGLKFSLTTGAEGHGDFRVILRHQPKKPNTGLDDAGGETDMDISFHVHVE
ncbi:type 1 periplasmic binding fold superfamily protein [Sinomicrobium oceani]|uniref:type 1 periplasmic binding fold superfamily protein n=1 Tax=Sinomicrobium oceani TaxID=1150368 RepID=UPI00227BC61D|nr:type 1 periplasmic binding fold superfamily protein [Sinomicrobium oceani]